MKKTVSEAFERRFGEAPEVIVWGPGRVNLIGEHTDYNDGFVLPMAIDRAAWIALRPRDDSRIALYSLDLEEGIEFDPETVARDADHWSAYPQGVAWALREAGHDLTGWEGVMASDVPIGSGLSSSAAIELAVARAFGEVSGFAWEPKRMALLAQKVENEWVGVNCGIMDQMVSAAAQEGAALLIDCRTLELSPVPLPPGTAVAVLDTATRRGLVDSAYNERRAQCETAAAYFDVPALRDVDLETFERRAAELDDVTRRRARHVISENDRTLRAADAMRSADARALGRLMDQSHESLREDFEVTNDALNIIVELARDAPGCLGARMTGAGFGGCAVALIDESESDAFAAKVSETYRTRTELKPAVMICRPSAGAGVL